MYYWQFSKKNSSLQKWGPFLPKIEKRKFGSISLTVPDRMISSNVLTHRLSKQCTLGNFQKILRPKNGDHFDFLNFCQKWKNTNLFLAP